MKLKFISIFVLLLWLGFGFAQDKTLIIAIPSDMQNLDPTLSGGDVITQEVLTSVYSFLIDFKREQNAEGQWIGNADEFVGDVAESFEISEDGTKVTFRLRPGIKFSNGDPIDANAVKFTYDRIFGQGGITAFLTGMAAVKDGNSVQVIDDLTVEFTLDTPNTLLFGNMAQFGHAILNPNVVEPYMTADDPWAHEWLQNNTAGTESGPYVLANWDRGNEIVLERNPNYWGTVENDRVILKIIPDASARLAQLQAGAVDMAVGIPTKDIANLEGNADITVQRFTTRAVGYIGMNNEVAPFDNVKVRQAISYAIPYDVIIDNVLNGYGIQLTSPIPQGTPYHTDEYFQYSQDPEKAKALLAEAGFPDGFDATFTIPNDNAEAKEGAVWVQSALKDIGINVTIEEMPGAAFTEKMQKREHGFFWANQWISINNDPFYHMFWLLKADCCDYAKYSNERVWELIDQYTLSTDAAAREAAAMEIQQTVIEEAPWIFLFQPDAVITMRSNVEGYTWYSADRYLRPQYLKLSDW
ncbi:MAG: ABC transporter substrate-binding protein [Trueperaceae bacterium]|nr:ABC transporter substrate-binding protein [Trueperaceae bacterium]